MVCARAFYERTGEGEGLSFAMGEHGASQLANLGACLRDIGLCFEVARRAFALGVHIGEGNALD